MDVLRKLGTVFGIGTPQSEAKQRAQAVIMGPHDVAPPDNVQYAYDWLTGDGISSYTGGKIAPMSPEGASGILGNWMTETGDTTLTNLDVIEEKARAGRGMSQYTAARRGPYDAWREELLASGGDPNSMDNQLKYFADEYLGKYDPAPGKSLVGYTNSLDELDGMDATAAATHLQRDFFRPSKPHLDKRIHYANEIYDRFN